MNDTDGRAQNDYVHQNFCDIDVWAEGYRAQEMDIDVYVKGLRSQKLNDIDLCIEAKRTQRWNYIDACIEVEWLMCVYKEIRLKCWMTLTCICSI